MNSAQTQHPDPSSAASHIPATAVPHYRRLADGLSNLVEEGILSKCQIPEDYEWLVETLTAIAGADPILLPAPTSGPADQSGE